MFWAHMQIFTSVHGVVLGMCISEGRTGDLNKRLLRLHLNELQGEHSCNDKQSSTCRRRWVLLLHLIRANLLQREWVCFINEKVMYTVCLDIEGNALDWESNAERDILVIHCIFLLTSKPWIVCILNTCIFMSCFGKLLSFNILSLPGKTLYLQNYY